MIMREFDLGLWLISRDFKADDASYDSLLDRTIAAGASPIVCEATEKMPYACPNGELSYSKLKL